MTVNSVVQHRIASVEAMLEFARDLGLRAQGGSVWLLSGDLGAGKTHWTKGFVAGIGSEAVVTSPTFGLVHEYHGGRHPVFHFDFYRLGSADELYGIGWDDYLDRNGIVIAEWGDRFPEAFPGPTSTVRISAQPDGSRLVEIG